MEKEGLNWFNPTWFQFLENFKTYDYYITNKLSLFLSVSSKGYRQFRPEDKEKFIKEHINFPFLKDLIEIAFRNPEREYSNRMLDAKINYLQK